MGFELTLLIMLPRKWKPYNAHPSWKEPIELWEIESVLNIDRISAPVNDVGFKERSPRMRAALHFLDSFWRSLSRELEISKERCFAPPFAVKEREKGDVKMPHWEWRQKVLSEPDPGYKYIVPAEGCSFDAFIPPLHTALMHNDILEKRSWSLKEDVILRLPLIWIPCSTLCEWITEGEPISYYKKHLETDHVACAFYSIWRANIFEMGKIGAMCLFYFDSVRTPTSA